MYEPGGRLASAAPADDFRHLRQVQAIHPVLSENNKESKHQPDEPAKETQIRAGLHFIDIAFLQLGNRSFSSLSDDSEEARARYLYRQWVGLGLTDVHLSNHTVLLSLPGSTPNTITDRSSHQCFLPNGIPCDQRGPNDLPRQQFSYAAYSAVGSVQGEVVDVQYGRVDDLRRAKDSLNLTNRIAVVKLGQAPLLYKLSLLSELGFGGVLLYVDPCDAPPGRPTWNQAFRVTLNPGGNPAIVNSELLCFCNVTQARVTSPVRLPSVLSLDNFSSLSALSKDDSWFCCGGAAILCVSCPLSTEIAGMSREAGGSLTSLLVQPISAFLAKKILSSPSAAQGDTCIPLSMPPNTELSAVKAVGDVVLPSPLSSLIVVHSFLLERKKIMLTVGSQLSYKKIYNVVGYLKGRRNPDRYVLVGSRHDSDQLGGASAIMNQLIAALTEQTKRGWVPDRTTVFCSWGGSALGNIGSFEWGKDNRVVLQSSAVAYSVSSFSPPRQRQLLSCIRGGNCPGPNVSSLQLPGDVSFFANQLAVPTVEFAFEQTKAEEYIGSRFDATSFVVLNDKRSKSIVGFKRTVDELVKWAKKVAQSSRTILRAAHRGEAFRIMHADQFSSLLPKENVVDHRLGLELLSNGTFFESFIGERYQIWVSRYYDFVSIYPVVGPCEFLTFLKQFGAKRQRTKHHGNPSFSLIKKTSAAEGRSHQLLVITSNSTTGFLSEAQFSVEAPETLDPLFKFHETIAKPVTSSARKCQCGERRGSQQSGIKHERLTATVIAFPNTLGLLRRCCGRLLHHCDDKLLYPLLAGEKSVVSPSLLSSATSLRDHAAFFQSETMRPANDPKERDPSHVRMLNDVLRDLEKSFIIPQTPPGVYRNLLYSLPGKSSEFSVLRFSQEAALHCNVTSKSVRHNSADKEVLCHSTRNQSLSLILRAIQSAERLVCFGLDLFENYPSETL
ncbi:hypothetical protein F2P81_006025 [Scophthalmus maximus]|uniref:N-acetylated alpha-linked acidic dipeptidase like 2 n=1 Tax=Scophthalmus maximus TaxID=52904 RepID=A0A6A4T8U8_SCOMX|nr:hypothetical protein F2P81_006025 [Scophthalmus maximus]